MDTTKAEILKNADWENIYKELIFDIRIKMGRYPQFFVRPGPDNMGLGETLEDIAQKIITKVIKGDLTWDPQDPEYGDLLGTLKYNVRGVLSNLASKKSFQNELLLIDQSDNDYPSQSDSLSESSYRARWKVLDDAAGEDIEIKELVTAMKYVVFEKGIEPKRQILADRLKIPPEEVTNRQKRLKRRIKNIQNEPKKEF
jgi:hypothetical protein